MTGAFLDCERILDGFLAQPTNALTSLAFVGVGAVVWRRPERRWIAAALLATGVGSFLFHGPMPPGAQWAHDVSLAWLLVAVGAFATRWAAWAGWPALLGIGATLWVVPAVADPLAGIGAVLAIGGILWRRRTPRTWFALGLLGLGAVVGRMSSSEGPWCNPDTLFQGHGFWHLAAASAVVIWASETGPASSDLRNVALGATRN